MLPGRVKLVSCTDQHHTYFINTEREIKKNNYFFVKMIKKVCGLYGMTEIFIGVSGDLLHK